MVFNISFVPVVIVFATSVAQGDSVASVAAVVVDNQPRVPAHRVKAAARIRQQRVRTVELLDLSVLQQHDPESVNRNQSINREVGERHQEHPHTESYQASFQLTPDTRLKFSFPWLQFNKRTQIRPNGTNTRTQFSLRHSLVVIKDGVDSVGDGQHAAIVEFGANC